MENNHNLEKYFRSKFNQKIEPESWNTPESDTWDKILVGLKKKDKKRRTGLLPFIIMALSLLFSVVLTINNHQKSKAISLLEKELIQCSTKPSNSSPEHLSSINKDVFYEDNFAKTPSYSQKKGKALNARSQNLQSNSYAISFQGKSEFSDSEIQSSKPELTDKDIEWTEYVSKRGFEQKKSNTLSGNIYIMNVPALNIKHLQSNRTLPIINPQTTSTIIHPKQENAKVYTFGSAMEYKFWHDRISGRFDNPLSELLINEETTPSTSFGFAFNKKIDKNWLLKTGLLYYQRAQSSQYVLNLPYSIANEIHIGSEYENRFEHSLPTGLGDINTSLVLSRSVNSPVKNNENVSIDFSLQHHTNALSLPLMMSYYLKNTDEGFFIQGGLVCEWILKNKIRSIDTESHHTFVKDKSIAVNFNESQINKINVSAAMGLGFEKEINKGFGISASVNYGFALTNTFATPNYQHKIDQLGLQIMLLKGIH